MFNCKPLFQISPLSILRIPACRYYQEVDNELSLTSFTRSETPHENSSARMDKRNAVSSRGVPRYRGALPYGHRIFYIFICELFSSKSRMLQEVLQIECKVVRGRIL